MKKDKRENAINFGEFVKANKNKMPRPDYTTKKNSKGEWVVVNPNSPTSQDNKKQQQR